MSAERSFGKEVELPRLGDGETFHGEGILAVTKALQAPIESWLDMIASAAALDAALAIEIADRARLIKGYGDTHRRGLKNFDLITQTLIAPALAGETAPATAATRITQARDAALADPEGGALAESLAGTMGKAAE